MSQHRRQAINGRDAIFRAFTGTVPVGAGGFVEIKPETICRKRPWAIQPLEIVAAQLTGAEYVAALLWWFTA